MVQAAPEPARCLMTESSCLDRQKSAPRAAGMVHGRPSGTGAAPVRVPEPSPDHPLPAPGQAADWPGNATFPDPGSVMILVIDNYDSFTFNLVQYLGELGAELQVRRNDELGVAGIEALNPERIVISPGPCTPNEAGVSVEVIRELGPRVPILGVCLGHQSIGAAYGGEVVRAERVMHGKTSPIRHTGVGIFSA